MRIVSIPLAVFFGSLCFHPLCAAQDLKMYTVKLQPRTTVEEKLGKAGRPSKLSPALIAVQDADGVYKGADKKGTPVIAVTADNLAKLQASVAVASAAPADPGSWNPVTRLRIKYKEKLTASEFDSYGLKQIGEVSEEGSFVVVDVGDKAIDAKFVTKLEQCAKIEHIVPGFAVRQTDPPVPPK